MSTHHQRSNKNQTLRFFGSDFRCNLLVSNQVWCLLDALVTMSPRSISTPLHSSPIRFFSPWHHQHLHRSCCCCSAIYELLITSRLLHKAPTSGPPLPGEHVAGVGQHKRRLKTEIRGCRSDGSGSPCRRSSWNCLGDNFLPPSSLQNTAVEVQIGREWNT